MDAPKSKLFCAVDLQRAYMLFLLVVKFVGVVRR